jgi:hypothetical protein
MTQLLHESNRVHHVETHKLERLKFRLFRDWRVQRLQPWANVAPLPQLATTLRHGMYADSSPFWTGKERTPFEHYSAEREVSVENRPNLYRQKRIHKTAMVFVVNR